MNYGKSRNSQWLRRQIILSFFIVSVVTLFLFVIKAILQRPSLFDNLMLIVGIVGISEIIVGSITYQRNKIIEQEKAKMIEENIKLNNNQLAFNHSASALVEIAKNTLNNIAEHPELISEKEHILSLVHELDALQENQSCQTTRIWLENTENLENIAKESSNFALTVYPIKGLETIFHKNQSKDDLYRNIYNCLLWIKASFEHGKYLTKNPPKISDKKRTIYALNWIKTEFLSEDLRQELGSYFNKLIQIIPQPRK